LFSAMELETAVRLKCNLVHLVWIDGFYDMVGIQEMAKYGRLSGVDLGPVDVAQFAEAFGAKGLRIETPDQISSTIKEGSRNARTGNCRDTRGLQRQSPAHGDCASRCAGLRRSRETKSIDRSQPSQDAGM
jgi:hypothetical protein